jgi:hypothetical protein
MYCKPYPVQRAQKLVWNVYLRVCAAKWGLHNLLQYSKQYPAPSRMQLVVPHVEVDYRCGQFRKLQAISSCTLKAAPCTLAPE